MDLYKKAVGRDEHPEGEGERIHPTLPIYVNREARIFCYWITNQGCRGRSKSTTTAREGRSGPQPLNACIATAGFRVRTVY